VKLQIPPRQAGTGRLRSELVTFLIWPVVCGWKAGKSICQQASPGFPRLCSGQALRLRAISRPLCDRSARRFAQDDVFVGGEKDPVSYAENTKRSKKSQALGMTKGGAALPSKVCRTDPGLKRETPRHAPRQAGTGGAGWGTLRFHVLVRCYQDQSPRTKLVTPTSTGAMLASRSGHVPERT
jgi:hypothetical protein